MPFVVVSNGPMGSDTLRAPQKAIYDPEPDGPSGPGTTKLVQRSPEAPKSVQGSLAYPIDTLVAANSRRGCLGRSRALPSPKSIQVQAELPAKIAPWMLFPWQEDQTPNAGYHGTHRTPGGS